MKQYVCHVVQDGTTGTMSLAGLATVACCHGNVVAELGFKPSGF